MANPARPDEMRIVIRAADEAPGAARPVPARLFRGAVSSVIDALEAANKELHSRRLRSEFFVAALEIGSNVFGVFEQQRGASPSMSPAIDLVGLTAAAVYRSDFARAKQYPAVARSIVKMAKQIDEQFPWMVQFPGLELPFDAFFARQAARLAESEDTPDRPHHFAGTAVSTFSGTLGSIDYRGATWRGYLVLPGDGAQIECVFDRTKGEDFFNAFGRKRVSVTGRAIFTGESRVPERLEVMQIKAIPLAARAIDIRGSLSGAEFRLGWIREGETFQ